MGRGGPRGPIGWSRTTRTTLEPPPVGVVIRVPSTSSSAPPPGSPFSGSPTRRCRFASHRRQLRLAWSRHAASRLLALRSRRSRLFRVVALRRRLAVVVARHALRRRLLSRRPSPRSLPPHASSTLGSACSATPPAALTPRYAPPDRRAPGERASATCTRGEDDRRPPLASHAVAPAAVPSHRLTHGSGKEEGKPAGEDAGGKPERTGEEIR